MTDSYKETCCRNFNYNLNIAFQPFSLCTQAYAKHVAKMISCNFTKCTFKSLSSLNKTRDAPSGLSQKDDTIM